MKIRKTLIGLASVALTLGTLNSALAAPTGSILNPLCTAEKIGNNVNITVSGTYNASNSNQKEYLINGFKIDLINNGNQQFKTTGLVSVAPTYVYTAIQKWTIPYKEGSSLKNATIGFYNGGSLKALTPAIPCNWK